MSSATEELHRLLVKRGAEYRFNESTKVFEWHFEGADGEGSAHATEVHGGINIIACSLTPEQAIEATLGRETCYPVPIYGFDGEKRKSFYIPNNRSGYMGFEKVEAWADAPEYGGDE